MNEEHASIPDNVRQKFPYLKPLKGAPSLYSVNGFGLAMYGKRDLDPETQTYIKTRCVCVLFIPLFAVDAYRVADAGSRSWFFFGKEALSGFVRSWNVAMACVVACAALAVGWNVHTSSPGYRAQQELKRAAEFLKAGEPAKAAAIYRQQVNGPATAAARKGLGEAVEACLQSDRPQTVTAAFRALAGLPPDVNQPAPLVPDAFQRGLSLVAKFRPDDADGALDVLEAVAVLNPKDETLTPLKTGLLQEAIAANPDNIKRVVELALLYETERQLDKSVKLLLPYRQKLGETEGARILGQYLLQQGQNEDAYSLLFPYVQTRLEKLRAIERSYTNTVATVSKRVLDELNRGQADDSFYENYKKAGKVKQEEMVDNYIQTRLKADPAFKRVLAELQEASQIVHVTLDLGIVQLNRAQNLKDTTARKAELESAEKTFLAIQGFAGDTDEYRLFLGQVYYWLGRSKEGKELFDELLVNNKRAYPILMSLGNTLRDVGETAEARALVEEAYQTTKSSKEKFTAAAFRALLFKDSDDQIAWLEKSDPEALWVQVELNSARGKKALQQGNKPLAADFLRKAISGYENQPKSAASLNNCGLACFDLYEATSNLEDHQRGMALLEEAIRMDPGNSILLHNTAHVLITRAVMDVVRDSIHTDALGEQPGLHMLSHLYQNDTERALVYQKLREDEAMKKGVAYLDKALLLAPKNLSLYETALAVHGGFRDATELQKLQQRFRIAAPDLAETRRETLASYAGEKDRQNQEKLQARIRAFEELLKSPAVSEHALTQEHVAVSLIGLWQNAWVYGGEIDSRKLVQTALATHQKHQSSASRHALKSAYFFRAGEELARQSPPYATLVSRTRRAISPEYLMAYDLERGGPLADLAMRNENVTRALALQKEIVASFPSWVSVSEWALLKTSAPDTATLLAKRWSENETARLIDELQFQFNPVSASVVLEQYWTHKLMGGERQALETYQTALRDGVPLPPL